MTAGTTIPPSAPATGSIAWRNVEKVSRNDLSLYLQADGEKEHHHQAVIDETFEVETEPEAADRNAYRCLQQRMVKFGCRRNIGKEHGDHHRKTAARRRPPIGY